MKNRKINYEFVGGGGGNFLLIFLSFLYFFPKHCGKIESQTQDQELNRNVNWVNCYMPTNVTKKPPLFPSSVSIFYPLFFFQDYQRVPGFKCSVFDATESPCLISDTFSREKSPAWTQVICIIWTWSSEKFLHRRVNTDMCDRHNMTEHIYKNSAMTSLINIKKRQ